MFSENAGLTNSFDTLSRHNKGPPNGSDAGSSLPSNNDAGPEHLKWRALSRQYTSLQEHAHHVSRLEELAEASFTPRHETRRESFTWGLRPIVETESRASRNPLPPDSNSPPASPPALADILRRASTNEDADSVQNMRTGLQHRSESFDEAQPSITQVSGSSSVGDSLSQTETKRSSIAAFAKGLAGHVPDMRMFPSPDRAAEKQEDPQRHDSQDAAFPNKKDRKLSFAPFPTLQLKRTSEKAPKPPGLVVEPPSTPSASPTQPRLAVAGGLRDRRKVKLDLSMPVQYPDLPARNRATHNVLASLTRSRPRSPQTPWIRDEQPMWGSTAIVKTAPILEEEYNHEDIMISAIQREPGLSPGPDVIFSSPSPIFERPPVKFRDRCYISRPHYKRSRSSRTNTSESVITRTPDGASSPTEQQSRTNDELRDLGMRNRTAHARRWKWKASSEDVPQAGDQPPIQPLKRRFSLNFFKRGDRISDRTEDNSKQQSGQFRRSRRGKQSDSDQQRATTSLAKMPLPPDFVPPGVSRVPTPPLFDTEYQIKGKLADFFFDIQGSAAGPSRGRPRKAPAGYWDSDAVLMSMNSGIDPSDEDDDEGPEGPRTENPPSPPSFDVNGTPGLMAGLDTGSISPDSWFRIHHASMLDDRALTTLALKEEDERRKFDWLIPEHLPSSPLCPLHPIYKGPCKGMCYWHQRRNSGGKGISNQHKEEWATEAEARPIIRRGSKDWEAGKHQDPVQAVKKRRLVSLSSS